MKKILVIEDDEKLQRILKIQLEYKNYEVFFESNGMEAFNHVHKYRDMYDLIILDLELPGMSGHNVCKNINKISKTPIIVLSARHNVEDKVELLQNGASDYITKPFDIEELDARINVNIRKTKETKLIYDIIEMDIENFTVKVDYQEIYLSKTEYELLKILLEKYERIVTREEIIETIWGWEASDNLLDSTMKNLRKKLNKTLIKTIRGIGYKLENENKKN